MNFVKQERELRLKDVVFSLLRRWRSVLVLALVCALALGGLKLYQVKKNVPQTVDRTGYEQSLASYQQQRQAKEAEVQWLTLRVERHRVYMQQSMMMQIDPTAVCRAGLDLYIVGAKEEAARRMLDDYRASLSDSAFVESAAQTMGMESKYLRALVSVSVMEKTVGESTQQYINVVLNHGQLEGAEQLLTLVLEQARSVEPEIRQSLGEHTLETVVLDPAIRVDNADLAGRQWQEKERMARYEGALVTAEKELAALRAPAEPVAPSVDTGAAVKFAVIGALLGGVLGCGWGLVAILFGDKLYSASDLRGRCNVKILGTVAGSGKRSLIDKMLDRLEGRRTADTADNDALVAAIIRKRLEGGTGVLIGDEARCQELAGRLGIEAIAGSLTGAEARERLERSEGVILLCVCGTSRCTQLEQTAELAEDLGKKIVGCIAAEY